MKPTKQTELEIQTDKEVKSEFYTAGWKLRQGFNVATLIIPSE